MQKLMYFFSRHPWAVFACLLVFSALAASQLQHVEIKVSADELLVRDDPERAYYEQVLERFGDEQIILVYLQDVELLNPTKLELLRSVIDKLEQQDFVARVESLFSIPNLRSVDGYLSKEPYLVDIPQTSEQGNALLGEALKNPFLKRVLISEDRRVMAIAVVLKDGEQSTDDYHVTEVIQLQVDRLASVYDQAFAIGFPYIRTEIAESIRNEQGALVPIAVLALLITLFVMLRQFVDILMPVMTAGISVLWTLGIMPVLGIPLNVVTSIVPILLIIVGSTEDIHLLSEFRQAQRREGCDVDRALHQMSKKMGRTVLFTFATTAVGFLSVSLSQIEMLWQFGLLAALGLLFNFLVTISLIPAVLKMVGNLQLDGGCKHFSDAAISRAGRYWGFLQEHRLRILLLLAIGVGIAGWGIPQIKVNHNAIDSLGKQSQVRLQVEQVNRDLAGLETLSIVLDSGIQETFLKVRYLEELVKIQDFLDNQGKAKSTTSFKNYLALLNGAFLELEQSEMPLSDAEVNELMIFLDYQHVRNYVSYDYSSARILVRHAISSTAELEVFVSEIQQFIDQSLDPGLDAHITGDSVLTLSAVRAMISGQLQSVFLLLVIIILLISIIFLDVKVGFLAALTNFLPVIVLFGAMGFLNIPLNIGTTMAAAIAIGIAVDDTLHFMLRYNQELRVSKQQDRAMVATIHGEILPVMSTSLALIAGFSIFALSDFEPVAQFGLLSALVIAAALVADLVLTPIVISSLRLVTIWDLLTVQLRKEVIAGSELFRGLRSWQIRNFVLSSTLMTYNQGDNIFHYGDASEELYMVMTGSIEVDLKDTDGEVAYSEIMKPGEIFGEVGLLADEPRKTDAFALETTTLLAMTRETLENSSRFNHLVMARLYRNLSKDISRRHFRYLESHSMLVDEDDR